MGCILSVCGFPTEQTIKIEPTDSMTLMIKNKECVRFVKLRKSLEVVVVKRNAVSDPVMFHQTHLQQPDQR